MYYDLKSIKTSHDLQNRINSNMKTFSQLQNHAWFDSKPSLKSPIINVTEEVINELVEGMGATTDNASITELFPAIAFNKGFRPSSVCLLYTSPSPRD